MTVTFWGTWFALSPKQQISGGHVKSISTFLIPALFAVSLTTLASPNTESPNATLMILLDLSTSMDIHRSKLTALAPILKESLEDNACRFNVMVGNIAYKGHDANLFYLKPIGDPAVVTESTPDGPEIIYNRILDPIGSAVNPAKVMRRGGLERTYSSIAMSIQANKKILQDSDVVGALLLTDAAPGFEKYTPEDAYGSIMESLGPKTAFYSGIISPHLTNGMTVPESHLNCPIDFSTKQTVGQPIDHLGFVTHNMSAINEFSNWVGGLQWEICEPDYNQRLRVFINTILAIAGCKPIS